MSFPTPHGIIVFDRYIFTPDKDDSGRDRWTVQLVFGPDADLTQMKEEVAKAWKEKFPKDKMTSAASPFKRYEGKVEELEGWTKVNFSTYQKPVVVDRRQLPIDSNSAIYSGCTALVVCYAKATGGGKLSKKASFTMSGIQCIEMNEPHYTGEDPKPHFQSFEAGEDAMAEGMADDIPAF